MAETGTRHSALPPTTPRSQLQALRPRVCFFCAASLSGNAPIALRHREILLWRLGGSAWRVELLALWSQLSHNQNLAQKWSNSESCKELRRRSLLTFTYPGFDFGSIGGRPPNRQRTDKTPGFMEASPRSDASRLARMTPWESGARSLRSCRIAAARCQPSSQTDHEAF